jgi:Lhr-like helicase
MDSDIFGNLMDWGLVLDKLNDLKKSEKLHKHQAGLIRILRYRNNWRLRETVLKYITYLNEPSDEMLTQVLNIMIDKSVYLDARILAADALANLIRKRKDARENDRTIDKVVIEKMETLLDSPQPPFLNEAIRKSLKMIMDK